jgi:hypothetical protein
MLRRCHLRLLSWVSHRGGETASRTYYIISYDSAVTPRPPSSTMLASLVLHNAVAPRAPRAMARPRRCAPAASRPLRHVARAAASGYVNPLRPGETEAQAAERRQRESDRISERTKVRPPLPRRLAPPRVAALRAHESARASHPCAPGRLCFPEPYLLTAARSIRPAR